MFRPCASRARARAAASNAVSVPMFHAGATACPHPSAAPGWLRDARCGGRLLLPDRHATRRPASDAAFTRRIWRGSHGTVPSPRAWPSSATPLPSPIRRAGRHPAVRPCRATRNPRRPSSTPRSARHSQARPAPPMPPAHPSVRRRRGALGPRAPRAPGPVHRSGPFPAVRLPHDLTWREDPFPSDPNWVFRLHGLEPVQDLIGGHGLDRRHAVHRASDRAGSGLGGRQRHGADPPSPYSSENRLTSIRDAGHPARVPGRRSALARRRRCRWGPRPGSAGSWSGTARSSPIPGSTCASATTP